MNSERLLLLPYSDAYFDDYFSYIMDAQLQKSLGLHGVTDRSSARIVFDWLINNRRFYAIILHSTEKAIGHICLHPCIQTIAESQELAGKHGLSISLAVSAAYQQRGIASEAIFILIDTLFRQEQIDYLEYEYLPSNKASCALQEKLGFSHLCTQTFGDLTLCTSILKNPK